MSAGRSNITDKTDWNTPPKYIELVKKMFIQIDLDPCSNENSLVDAKVKYMLPIDGLKESWNFSRIFVNPPYGRDTENKTSLKDWLKKGKIANDNGSELLYLIPVATNTSHFKDIIFKSANSICFLEDTRLKFWSDGIENKKGAPMACCIVYFGNNTMKFKEVFGKAGKCFKI